MYVISKVQIKILPEYWIFFFFWYVLQNSSLGCRLRWSLVLECLSGVPLWWTFIESEEKKQGRAEGKSSCNTVQMTLADPMGVWSEDSPSGFSWQVHWPGFYASPWMHRCIKAIPRGPGGWRLPTDSTSSNWTTSPQREVWTAHHHVPTASITAPEVGDEDVLWGKLDFLVCSSTLCTSHFSHKKVKK